MSSAQPISIQVSSVRTSCAIKRMVWVGCMFIMMRRDLRIAIDRSLPIFTQAHAPELSTRMTTVWIPCGESQLFIIFSAKLVAVRNFRGVIDSFPLF